MNQIAYISWHFLSLLFEFHSGVLLCYEYERESSSFWKHWFVCLFVCLSVSNITKKVINGLRWRKQVIKFVVIWITMLTTRLKIWPLLNKLGANYDEIFRITLQWYKEHLIKFLGWIWIAMLTQNFESRQCGVLIVNCLVRDLCSLSVFVIIKKSVAA